MMFPDSPTPGDHESVRRNRDAALLTARAASPTRLALVQADRVARRGPRCRWATRSVSPPTTTSNAPTDYREWTARSRSYARAPELLHSALTDEEASVLIAMSGWWLGSILFFIVWILIAFWPARVASRKGHSFLLYFLLSLVFFPLSLILAYVVSDRRALA